MDPTDSHSDNQPLNPISLDIQAIAREAQEILGFMLPFLSFEAKLETFIERESVRIRVDCQDAARLIGRRGSTVNEIQFLLNLILQRRYKLVPRILLDISGPFEAKTQAQTSVAQISENEIDPEIIERIQSLVNQVRRWGEPLESEPLSTIHRKHVQEIFTKDHEIEVIDLGTQGDSSKPQRLQFCLRKRDVG